MMSELPITYRGAVYPWHCDHMGHMNVMWYVGKFDEATWQLFSLLGLSTAFLRQHNRGMAAIEQRIAYKRELLAGDLVTVRSGILEMKEKVVRLFHEMVNQGTGEISAITVLTGIHMDIQARKACPFPEEILAGGRTMVIDYDPGI
jgi:acyl-CoA thioester hydrolase